MLGDLYNWTSYSNYTVLLLLDISDVSSKKRKDIVLTCQRMPAAFELICEMNLFNCKYQPPGADPMVFKFFLFLLGGGGVWPPKLEFQERPRLKKLFGLCPPFHLFFKKKKSAK